MDSLNLKRQQHSDQTLQNNIICQSFGVKFEHAGASRSLIMYRFKQNDGQYVTLNFVQIEKQLMLLATHIISSRCYLRNNEIRNTHCIYRYTYSNQVEYRAPCTRTIQELDSHLYPQKSIFSTRI